MSSGTIYKEKERKDMAEVYLMFKTFRRAADRTGYSKSTIHKVVNDFIDNGEFDRVSELKTLVEENKRERALRGGMATAAKWRAMKK